MRINNNIMALNAHRQLGVNQANGAKSMERLSSGLRINRAGDDAAGLAISEKMRGQIRGLKQASRNAQDGISLIQTAEGALNETHAILQRMRELAVQSATDTNTEVDRGEIQKEIDELAAEISRIADTTEFNTQNLLGGSFKGTFHIGANEGQDITLSINAMDADALAVSGDGEGQALYTISGTTTNSTSADAAALGLSTTETNTLSVVEIDNVTIQSGQVANYGLANEDGEVIAVSTDGKTYNILQEATKIGDLSSASKDATGTIGFADAVLSGSVTLDASAASPTVLSNIEGSASIDVEGLATGEYSIEMYTDQLDGEFSWQNGSGGAVAENTVITSVLTNAQGEVVAISADEQNYYSIDDVDADADVAGTEIADRLVSGAQPMFTSATTFTGGESLSVEADGGIDVSSQEAASKAITTINKAIETVSAERSKLGAYQNRLEHTIANLGTSAENLQAAEARIRDLDMAEEIMAFTKNNILQQAATAMLAQANMAPQSVLQLLG